MEINQGARSYVRETAQTLINALEIHKYRWDNEAMGQAEAFRIALRALGNNAPRPGQELVNLAIRILNQQESY